MSIAAPRHGCCVKSPAAIKWEQFHLDQAKRFQGLTGQNRFYSNLCAPFVPPWTPVADPSGLSSITPLTDCGVMLTGKSSALLDGDGGISAPAVGVPSDGFYWAAQFQVPTLPMPGGPSDYFGIFSPMTFQGVYIIVPSTSPLPNYTLQIFDGATITFPDTGIPVDMAIHDIAMWGSGTTAHLLYDNNVIRDFTGQPIPTAAVINTLLAFAFRALPQTSIKFFNYLVVGTP